MVRSQESRPDRASRRPRAGGRLSWPSPCCHPSDEPQPRPRRRAIRPTASASATGRPPTGAPTPTTRPSTRCCPSDPRLHPRSAAVVARLTEQGGPSDLRAGVADSDGDFQHPTYWSTPDDPVFTIHCTRPYGRCEVEGMRVRIPDRARPAGRLGRSPHRGRPADAAGSTTSGRWTSKPSGGGELDDRLRRAHPHRRRRARLGRHGRPLRPPGRDHPGPGAAQRGRIDHALFLVADCDSGEFVYPARGRGAPCDGPHRRARARACASSSTCPTPRSARSERRAGSAAILRALARYGMFVGDTGGSPWDLEFESGSTYTSFGYPDPIVRLRQAASASRARPTAATTSTSTRGSTGGAACAWWTRA